MKTRRIAFLCLALLAIRPAAADPGQIPVELRYPTKVTEMVLVGIEGGELVFRPPGVDEGGRAYLSIRELERRRAVVNALYPPAFAEALRELETGDAEAALPKLERIARPVVPYLELGPVAGNLVPAVDAWLEALVETGRLEEAAALAGSIPLAEVPVSLFARVVDLGIRLAEAGKAVLADGLRREFLSVNIWPRAHQEELMRLAGLDRREDRWAEAAELYRLVESQAGALSPAARLWGAYCRIEADPDPPAEGFLATLPAPAEQDPSFPLAQLVRARALERLDRPGEAMRAAASGVTAAPVDREWFPPLLLLAARLYETHGDRAAAESAYRQTVFLFPDSAWSGRASDALDELKESHETEPETTL